MSDLQTHAADIADQFSEHLDVSTDEVEARLEDLVHQYKVPIDEARRSVTNSYLEEAGLEREDIGPTGSESVQAAEIDQDEQWVDMTVKVVDLWEPRSDAIAQVGLLGDESGTIKFVSFTTSELPALEEGAVYRLGNVVTDEYQGQYSVKLNRTTTIAEIDEEIEVGDDSVEIEGALLDVQAGSGLIKRCTVDDCTRVLQNGQCSEHGDVDEEFDLRIKAVLDDGESVNEVIFDRERTEALTGIDLDEAKRMAQDALDVSVVTEEIERAILGRYYRITGPQFGRYAFVDTVEELGAPADHDDVLVAGRSI